MLGIEFTPSLDFNEDIDLLKELMEFLSIDFIIIPDNPAGKISANPIVCATLLEQTLSITSYPAISGGGRTKEHCISLLYAAKYAHLKGVACINGGANFLSTQMLKEAKDLNFDTLICTPNDLDLKIQSGANLCITQPIFDWISRPTHSCIQILPTFMPIFSQETLIHLQKKSSKLGFEINLDSRNLFQSNAKLLKFFSQGDYYLSILNLKKQLPHLRRLYQVIGEGEK